MHQKHIFIFFFCFWSFFTAFAEPKNTLVWGKVLLTNGKPAEGISVFIKNTTCGTVTDQYGKFQIYAPAGKQILVIHSFWTQRLDIPIEVLPDTENKIPHITIAEDTQQLGEVVVTGTRTAKSLSSAPVLTKIVTGKELTQTGVTTALDALQSAMPGIQFSPDGHGANMTIQGLSNDYVLVMVDGERLVGETRGNVNLERISANDIRQIEIVNGASSVLYGSNAIGGVINIITKNADKPIETMLQTRYSSFNTWNSNLNIGTRRKKLNVKVNTFRNSSAGYDLTPQTPETYTANPFVDYSISTKASYTFSRNWEISLRGVYFRHEYFNPPQSLKSTHKLNNNITVGGKTTYKTKVHTLVLGINMDKYNAHNVYEKRNDSTSLKSDFQFTTLSLIDTYIPNDKWEFVMGAEMNTERMFSENLFGKGETSKDKTKRTSDINLFLQTDWKMLKNLEWIGGVRYTQHSSFGKHITPKLSAMYTYGKFKFRANAALGYKSPSLRELFYNYDHQGMFWIHGNRNLKPESSRYYSLSAEYTRMRFNLSVNAFYNEIDHKISMQSIQDNTSDKMEFHHYNIDQVRVQGIETYLNWTLSKNLKLKTGYVLSDAIDKTTGSQIYGNSKHAATTALTFHTHSMHYPFSVTLSGQMASSRLHQVRSVDNEGKMINEMFESEPYSIWRLTYVQQFPSWRHLSAEMQLGIDNVLNYLNIEKSAIINPGRTYWAAVTFKL